MNLSYIFYILVLLGVAVLLDKSKIWNGMNTDSRLKLLLIYVAIGGMIGFENNSDFGCMFGLSQFSIFNLSLTTTSLTFLWLAKLKKVSPISILLLAELCFWVFKYLVFKGGYIMGYAGDPDFLIVTYDIIGLMLRLNILYSLLKLGRTKKHLITALTFLIISIKIGLFSYPIASTISDKRGIERYNALPPKMSGNWKGKILDNQDSVLTKNLAVRIDTSKMTFSNNPYLIGTYDYNLDYLYGGSLKIEGIDTSKRYYSYDINNVDLDKNKLSFNLVNGSFYSVELSRQD